LAVDPTRKLMYAEPTVSVIGDCWGALIIPPLARLTMDSGNYAVGDDPARRDDGDIRKQPFPSVYSFKHTDHGVQPEAPETMEPIQRAMILFEEDV
jgi:hypothetical protein